MRFVFCGVVFCFLFWFFFVFLIFFLQSICRTEARDMPSDLFPRLIAQILQLDFNPILCWFIFFIFIFIFIFFPLSLLINWLILFIFLFLFLGFLGVFFEIHMLLASSGY